MKTILAAVDFSAISTSVIAEAATLASAHHGKVVLVHVTEPTATVVDFAVVSMSVARVDEARVAQTKARLESMQQDLTARNVTAEARHAVGTPDVEIVSAAKELAAAYIVIGSHGHSALRDLFMGSTTSGVVKRAACPVVVITMTAHEASGETAASAPEAT